MELITGFLTRAVPPDWQAARARAPL